MHFLFLCFLAVFELILVRPTVKSTLRIGCVSELLVDLVNAEYLTQ